MRVEIKLHHLEEILKKAKESKIEICGFLLGQKKGESVIIEEIAFAENKLNSPVEFEIDPLEIVKILDYADKKGLEPVGLFHSHLCKPIPSGKDIKGMKNWRNIWLIVDNRGNYGAFVLNKDYKIKEVEILIKK